jgi:hypothetical protein
MKAIGFVLFIACCLILAVITTLAISKSDNSQIRGQIEYPFGVASYDSCKAEIELDQRILIHDFRGYKVTTKYDSISTLYRFTSGGEELLLVCDNIRDSMIVSFKGQGVLNRLNGKFGFVGPESEIALK